jgi:hypothetical protein
MGWQGESYWRVAGSGQLRAGPDRSRARLRTLAFPTAGVSQIEPRTITITINTSIELSGYRLWLTLIFGIVTIVVGIVLRALLLL